MLQIFLSKLDLLTIRLLIPPSRSMQSIPLLMVCLYQILHYTVLLLGVWYILLLLLLIFLMMFMLSVSLLLLPLWFIGQLFFIFCGTFKVQSFRVFYFHLPHLWSYVHTLMLIRTMIPLIADLLLVSISFWVIFLFLRGVRNNPLFLYLQLKQNIML